MKIESTKIIELGSTAFRQWKADHSHCKFLHGYRLISKYWFGCQHLDDKNWVVDFGGLDELKSILQKQFDHTLCVAADDPQLTLFKSLHSAGVCDLRIMQDGVGIERTAEYCFNIADSYIRHLSNSRCWVEKVEVWEHEKNSAIVRTYNLADILLSKCDPMNLVNTFAETTPTSTVPVPEPVVQVQDVQPEQPQGARVGNPPVTSGWSNPFAGTSWGS